MKLKKEHQDYIDKQTKILDQMEDLLRIQMIPFNKKPKLSLFDWFRSLFK